MVKYEAFLVLKEKTISFLRGVEDTLIKCQLQVEHELKVNKSEDHSFNEKPVGGSDHLESSHESATEGCTIF